MEFNYYIKFFTRDLFIVRVFCKWIKKILVYLRVICYMIMFLKTLRIENNELFKVARDGGISSLVYYVKVSESFRRGVSFSYQDRSTITRCCEYFLIAVT